MVCIFIEAAFVIFEIWHCIKVNVREKETSFGDKVCTFLL